jgi:hypothetical protein
VKIWPVCGKPPNKAWTFVKIATARARSPFPVIYSHIGSVGVFLQVTFLDGREDNVLMRYNWHPAANVLKWANPAGDPNTQI